MGQNTLKITDDFRAKLANSSERTDAQIKGLKLYAEKVRKVNN